MTKKKEQAELDPRKEPKQSRAKKTVGYIIDATAQVLENIGYDKISTNKIAKRAGVSIGSLYQYFPSKESIIDYMVDEYITKHFQVLKEKLDAMEDTSLDEVIRHILSAFLSLFEQKRQLRIALLRNIPRGVFPKIHEAEDNFQKVIIEKLTPYKDQIKRNDLEIATYVVIQSVAGSVRGTLSTNRDIDLNKLEDELFVLIKNYLTL